MGCRNNHTSHILQKYQGKVDSGVGETAPIVHAIFRSEPPVPTIPEQRKLPLPLAPLLQCSEPNPTVTNLPRWQSASPSDCSATAPQQPPVRSKKKPTMDNSIGNSVDTQDTVTNFRFTSFPASLSRIHNNNNTAGATSTAGCPTTARKRTFFGSATVAAAAT